MKDVVVTDLGSIQYPEGRVMAKAVLDLADYAKLINVIEKLETRLDDAMCDLCIAMELDDKLNEQQ